MRKFYLTLVVVVMAFTGSLAQTGIYVGSAHVSGGLKGILEIDSIVPNITADFRFSGDDYSFFVRDINLMGSIVNLEMHQMIVSEIDGGWLLERSGFESFNIPKVSYEMMGKEYVYYNIPAKLYWNQGSVIDDILVANMTVSTQVQFPFGMYAVEFPLLYESYPPDNVSIPEMPSNVISIYPTIVSDGNIYIGGLSAVAEYSVYSFTGIVVKSGVTSGFVDVGSLNKGFYILRVAGKTAKFRIN